MTVSLSSEMPRALRERLWPHQVAAITFALPYLRSRGGGNGNGRAALVRMPTGTGKTGVIAVLSAGVPPDGWTLILTPWKNLCDQMVDDISRDFWQVIGWTPSAAAQAVRLLPSSINDVLARDDERLILVTTFATLVTLFKQRRHSHAALAARLAQVIVDEGHYEPAVEWGQAVKQLKKPTLLLTATPYRNDLKLFRISAADVHHYTHQAAESDRIIRRIDLSVLGETQPGDRRLDEWCDQFAAFWKGPQPRQLHRTPRAIVCCATLATVKRVTRLLRDRKIDAVGIHHRFGAAREKWLLKDTPQPHTVAFDVWVHQNKLTEGLDDSRFCVLAVLDRIGNDRKLIQQIGRVLRTGQAQSTKRRTRAMVLYSQDLAIRESWDHYRRFETRPNLVEPERYREMLDALLAAQPDMEYFGGRFRARFDPSHPDLSAHVLLRPSVVVRRTLETFRFDDFIDFTSDYLLLHDRILLGPTNGPETGKKDSRLWVYAVIGNSGVLKRQSHYEIRLGACAAVQHGDLVFMVDTESLYPAEYLSEHSVKLQPDSLARVVEHKATAREVSLLSPWPAGPTVRRSILSSDNLAHTPTQLTDSVLFCAGIRTISPQARGSRRRRHYLGFLRSRIAEQVAAVQRDTFTLDEFVDWTGELADSIATKRRRTMDFFRRYLARVEPPTEVAPRYVVFNLFEGDLALLDESGKSVELCESILSIVAQPNPERWLWTFVIRFHVDGSIREHTSEAALVYDLKTSRFRIRGENVNSEIFVDDGTGTAPVGFVTYLNNNSETFTVALADADLYYTSDSFFRIDYTYAETRLTDLLTADTRLRAVTSEKGDPPYGRRWNRNSVFGVVAAIGAGSLLRRYFGPVQWLFCDDLNAEVADFVVANFADRKIAFIHAKHAAGRTVSASAFHDVVAQALKNLGVLSPGGATPAQIARWHRNARWSTTHIRRWRHGVRALPVRQQMWQRIRQEILDHPHGQKEVWLVVGQTLERARFLEQLANPAERTAITGQLVYLLSGLNASCTQLGAGLKVFCH